MRTKTHPSKVCSKCQGVKSLTEFYKDVSRKNNLTPWCRDCCKEQHTLNRDARTARMRQRYVVKREAILADAKAKYVPVVNGSPGTVRYEAKLAGFRSGFERSVDMQLKVSGVEYTYEPCKLPYKLEYNYIPDFYLPATKIYVEVKGYLRTEDRAKMIAVKKQHPDLDIRFLFGEGEKKIARGKQTNAQWATKNGFPWAEGKLPEEWLTQ